MRDIYMTGEMRLKALEKESTAKNNLPDCQCTDAEIAKSFIEDVEAVKDQLPCGEQMDFPNTFDEFAKDYGFRDKKEVYTNGSELIPVFRVKQWLEHIQKPTTKNDSAHNLCDSCINYKCEFQSGIVRTKCAFYMPPVTPQEPILDKIRAEIAELSHYYPMGHDYQIAITRCLAVVDKYKVGSEYKK